MFMNVYIHEKVAEAKSLLRNTTQTPVAISTYLGYSSQSHFTTVFKRLTGVKPREYRKNPDAVDGG